MLDLVIVLLGLVAAFTLSFRREPNAKRLRVSRNVGRAYDDSYRKQPTPNAKHYTRLEND